MSIRHRIFTSTWLDDKGTSVHAYASHRKCISTSSIGEFPYGLECYASIAPPSYLESIYPHYYKMWIMDHFCYT